MGALPSGAVGEVRVVVCDGSVESVSELARALAVALEGGPAVLPVPDGPVAERDRIVAAARPDVESDAAALVPTSGSTGQVKIVELPATALSASARATHDRLGGPGTWLLALPARHIAGLQVLVRAALAATEPVVLDLRPGFRADAFAAAAGTMPGDGASYTALVPTQLAGLVDAGGPALDALRGFDAVLVGGAAAPPALVAAARSAGARIVTTYGMTETAGGCVYDGLALPGVRVRLDAERRIHLGGPTIAAGYRLRPDLTAAAFTGGWFRSDDLGAVGPDGTLRVIGRADEMIITGGANVAPAAVERALEASAQIAEACVVGLPDHRWGQLVAAAVVPSPGTAPDVDALRAAVRDHLGRAAVPRLIEIVERLPRHGIGKIDREAVRGYLDERRPS